MSSVRRPGEPCNEGAGTAAMQSLSPPRSRSQSVYRILQHMSWGTQHRTLFCTSHQEAQELSRLCAPLPALTIDRPFPAATLRRRIFPAIVLCRHLQSSASTRSTVVRLFGLQSSDYMVVICRQWSHCLPSTIWYFSAFGLRLIYIAIRL